MDGGGHGRLRHHASESLLLVDGLVDSSKQQHIASLLTMKPYNYIFWHGFIEGVFRISEGWLENTTKIYCMRGRHNS
jgi:hypothetical protein